MLEIYELSISEKMIGMLKNLYDSATVTIKNDFGVKCNEIKKVVLLEDSLSPLIFKLIVSKV